MGIGKIFSRGSIVVKFHFTAGSDWSAGATTLGIANLALVHSTAEYCAPFNCRVLRSIQLQSTALHAAVLTPASLNLPSTTHCELWLDDCFLHQRTTFLFSPASNLLSFLANEPHCLQYAVSWSLDIYTTHRSPVLRVGMHGTSNLNFHLCPPHIKLISSSDNNISAGLLADHRWNAEWLENTTRLRNVIPNTGTHPPGMTLPRTAWVRLTAFAQVSDVLLAQMGYGFLCGLWVWRRRTNHRPCYLPMPNPSIASWTSRPDGSGRWDNGMAAQHLPPRSIVRPSSGQQQLAQTASLIIHNHDMELLPGEEQLHVTYCQNRLCIIVRRDVWSHLK